MRRTVLSINGNKPMNYMLQTVLSRKYKFIAEGDVFLGMQQLRNNEAIELILVDVDSNPTESWEFIRHIKSSWIYNRPIVILTSDRTSATSEQATETGVDYFFQKPFSPVDLIKTIDALLYTPSGSTIFSA